MYTNEITCIQPSVQTKIPNSKQIKSKSNKQKKNQSTCKYVYATCQTKWKQTQCLLIDEQICATIIVNTIIKWSSNITTTTSTTVMISTCTCDINIFTNLIINKLQIGNVFMWLSVVSMNWHHRTYLEEL